MNGLLLATLKCIPLKFGLAIILSSVVNLLSERLAISHKAISLLFENHREDSRNGVSSH
ncbi:hypothetical protein XBO1_1610007 [Xenorhabdus bovienii str. oregonense]|uniref:Uncharacterized protein n=1 Tax=Xenorhabdus bovienii str. oregonense TaxID=1398202 RepID=A0A077NS96_XENBV|nr:hypothetical protein XBO1_1610007 [Xenorhabdus bovienii str. oregonense]